jgi:hypothetical protein
MRRFCLHLGKKPTSHKFRNVYGKLTWSREVKVVGFFSLSLRVIESKELEMVALKGMKTEETEWLASP